MMDIIKTYICELNDAYKTKIATEATYRNILQNLIKTLLPKVTIIHEPKRAMYRCADRYSISL